LEKFYKKIKNGGVGLFYFAGHGMELEGKNYLIPIDATPKKRIDVEFDSLPLDRITKNMQRANNRLNIVILDACRNNPFIRGGDGGLAKSEPIGLFLSYATEAGRVALDGERGGHGLFTENLIKYIKEPLNLQQVFKKTREAVYNASNKKQFPAIYDQTINGEFFFTKSIDKNISNNSISKIKTIEPIITKHSNNNQAKESYGLQTILKFFISNNKSPLLNTFFILLMILGFIIIIFSSFTSFLYSERTNYILKALAVFLFFFGISGYLMSTFLHISDKSSFFSSLVIGVLIIIIVIFFTPKQKNSKNSPKPISLIGSQAILLSDIKIGQTGHANIMTNTSRYKKLVRNKSDKNLFKGDEVIVMSDEAIPLVTKK
jgi:hypothetical protein